jgi:hypothetical protein
VRRGAEFHEAMGTDAFRLVAKIVPAMKQFLETEIDTCLEGHHQEVTVVRNSALWAKFRMACQKFLRVVSSELQPIVLFFDDMHSMDEGSREIIKSLHGCSDRSNVMMIVTYRDEDAEKVESTFVTKTVGVINIHLFDLTREAVTHLISDKIGLNIRHKSGSFLILSTASQWATRFTYVSSSVRYRERTTFSFDPSSACWRSDVDEIQHHMPVSVNLMDLLAFKIAKLCPELRRRSRLRPT